MTTKFSKKKEALSVLKKVFKSSHLQKARLANSVSSIHEPQTEKNSYFRLKEQKIESFV